MNSCNYWDCGWCYAPDDVKTNARIVSKVCHDPNNCPYLKSQNQITETDISKVLIDGDLATIMGVKCKGILDPQIYRIKKITQGNLFAYYPQRKYFGLFWIDELVGFGSYEDANKAYCDYLRDCMKEPVVEYLEVRCK